MVHILIILVTYTTRFRHLKTGVTPHHLHISPQKSSLVLHECLFHYADFKGL